MLLFHAHKCRHPSEFPRLAKVTTGGVFELLNVKGHPGHGNLVVPRQREGNGNLSTDMNKPNKFSGDKTPPRKLLRVDVECSHFDKTKWREEKLSTCIHRCYVFKQSATWIGKQCLSMSVRNFSHIFANIGSARPRSVSHVRS